MFYRGVPDTPYHADAVGSTSRIPGVDPIHMDDVHCTGSEVRLTACRHTSQHNCGHGEDAAASCRQRMYMNVVWMYGRMDV